MSKTDLKKKVMAIKRKVSTSEWESVQDTLNKRAVDAVRLR